MSCLKITDTFFNDPSVCSVHGVDRDSCSARWEKSLGPAGREARGDAARQGAADDQRLGVARRAPHRRVRLAVRRNPRAGPPLPGPARLLLRFPESARRKVGSHKSFKMYEERGIQISRFRSCLLLEASRLPTFGLALSQKRFG